MMIKDFEAYSKEYVTPEVKVFVVTQRKPLCDISNISTQSTDDWYDE